MGPAAAVSPSDLCLDEHPDRVERGGDVVIAFGTVQGVEEEGEARAATVRRMYQATGPDGKRLHTVAEIAQTAGVHRTTVYDYLNKEG